MRSTILSTEVPGRIADLPLREGERFNAGQRIAGIDCSLHKARLEKARAQAQGARKTHQVHTRLDKLNSISALEVEASAAQLAAAEAEVSMMQTLVDRCSITAPYPGRVVELKVRRDQYVAEGHELMEILDDRDLEVELIVPSRWLSWLKPGTPFSVRIEETGKTVSAKIVRLGARIDPVSQSIKIFGSLIQPTPDLIAGMSGTAQFELPR
ncbi:efflux RND transporter periplasmic adaptor subunit [Azospirillum canadense]|uniref:efflux RND transporter periplasmic adaptor subunit n=1 Tax=Azospirillum canadense TaxID=403962 RepID=UPI0022273253|nr:efflux RND transporter periplasmic adaptor subunit [Azospirillum canadense]MCW2242493.1 RND family efflux transporter MFP subunit [Azospirillum canadense]